jgi:hypothetical protein
LAVTVLEERPPGQVEFIPVAVHAMPGMAARLKFASACYFIDILRRELRPW